MKKVLLLSVLMLSVVFLSAQKSNTTSPNADQIEKLYKRLGYQAALDAARGKQAGKAKKMGATPTLSAKAGMIAESYRLTGNYAAAAVYYGYAVEKSDKAIYKLRLAQTLQAIGDCDKARLYALQYDSIMVADTAGVEPGKEDRRGMTLAVSCAFMSSMKTTSGVVIEPASFNTSSYEFSAIPWQGGVIFASNRKNNNRSSDNTDLWLNSDFCDLWYAPNGGNEAPKPLKGKVNSRFHEASASSAMGGDVIYFTRSLFNKGKRTKNDKGLTSLGIYSAQYVNGKWTNIEAMPFNKETRTYCHPTVSADGQRMYMASDGKANGFGGMDIYVSYNKGGKWSRPENLGPSVNTAGDEVFPMLNADGTLYFSSNGRGGMGGLDIFYTVATSDANDSLTWGRPINLGKPFNSNRDDFGFYLNNENNQGWLTSNREGGQGGDDIYKFRTEKPLDPQQGESMMVNIKLLDKKTAQPIAQGTLDIVQKGGDNKTLKETTDAMGQYQNNTFFVEGPQYDVVASKPGYQSESFIIPSGIGNKPLKQEYILRLNPNAPIAKTAIDGVPTGFGFREGAKTTKLIGTVVNANYNNRPVPNAKVEAKDNCTGEKAALLSDENGMFSIDLECGCDYLVKASKEGLNFDKKKILLKGKNECPEDVKETFVLGVERMGEFDEDDLESGSVIELNNVFYDYNKSDIRPDAAGDLDKLAGIMQKHPTMTIELSAHTDSRGQASYNQGLSQRRADAALEYLASKGIAKERMVAVGYGESNPRNGCTDKVICTEEQHQDNRRTEVKVTKFDKPIKVQIIHRAKVVRGKDGKNIIVPQPSTPGPRM